MEQKVLDNCSLLRQYKDLVYTHEYIVKSDGLIETRSIDAPREEIVDVMSSVE